MSHWPEPTPDPAEPPRWPGRAVLVALLAVVALVAAGENSLQSLQRSWRMPEFELPEIRLPNVNLGERAETSTPSGSEAPASPVQSLSEAGGATVQAASFEDCLATIEGAASNFAQRPILMEDAADRRVAVFKFLDGDLTVACSRPDSTMTLVRRP